MKKPSAQIIIIVLTYLVGFSINSYSQDWANTSKYRQENKDMEPRKPNEFRVVFMGNSITEFWKTNDSTYFFLNNYIDRGISGQTTSQMLIRFRQDVIELNPDVVVILAGINDIAENTGHIALKDVFGNIVSMVELAKSNNIKPILCSVLPAFDFYWRPGLEPVGKIIELNSLIKNYATENKLLYVDFYEQMKDENKALNKKYTEDGVHPNLQGYKIMEKIIEPALQKVRNM